jgi:NAD(P)H-flavin reductase
MDPVAQTILPHPTISDSRVVALNRLSDTGYELRIERNGINFKPGQLINIHGRNHMEDRSYTVCSGDRDEMLTVLFRLIPGGILTPQLAAMRPGDTIRVSGPYGEFVVRDTLRPIIFIATGTGVAPCRAYLRSHASLNLTLIHGVRVEQDLFYRDEFKSISYTPCLTRDETIRDVFHGRVTDYARQNLFPANSHYYLCGANEMIYEMQEILEQRGVDRSSIFTEAYYYRSDDS